VLITYMYRHGASRKALIMMIGNVVLDATFGSIPLIGNIFDFAYKANDRNIRIMKRHFEEGKYQGSGTGILISVGLLILVFMGLIIWGVVELFAWLFTEVNLSI
jgi:hypothetical protein